MTDDDLTRLEHVAKACAEGLDREVLTVRGNFVGHIVWGDVMEALDKARAALHPADTGDDR